MIIRNCGSCAYWHSNKPEHTKCKGCEKSGSTERPNYMPRNMKCPMCESEMIYNKRDAFLRCEDCGTEIWPFVNGGTIKEAVRQEFEKNLPCARNTDVSSVKMSSKGVKSSSKSKGSSKKGLMQKKPTSQLFRELAN